MESLHENINRHISITYDIFKYSGAIYSVI